MMHLLTSRATTSFCSPPNLFFFLSSYVRFLLVQRTLKRTLPSSVWPASSASHCGVLFLLFVFLLPRLSNPSLCPFSPYLQPPPRRMHLPLSLCKYTSRCVLCDVRSQVEEVLKFAALLDYHLLMLFYSCTFYLWIITKILFTIN